LLACGGGLDQAEPMLADRPAKGGILFGNRAGMGKAGRGALCLRAKSRDARASNRLPIVKLTAVGRARARMLQAASRLASEASARIASAKP